MAQAAFLNGNRSLRFQASDFLAIEEHVEITCEVLAARLFSKKPMHQITTQVLLLQACHTRHLLADQFASGMTIPRPPPLLLT
jgi:hypothetical protein